MAIIKCKMCGGDLNIVEGESVCECEYCGTRQTIPSADNEKKLTLFARANRLRLASEFDKAFGIYESIVAEFPEEAEAYWGLVLCKYGIEYVDDPATGKKIPTCHRSSFDSVMEDSDFEQACENADGIARKLYREEAKQIEEIRKGILEVSGKEEPYDIFICYKETDENGDRTLDSVLAQDIYDALTDKGYRVFFARITLEDKLGQEYEPYIFAALNSAKIMLAVGTDYEYYNAVWVKNEWSRYLKLMAKDKDKHLIPCYKNLDAYDMPKEFGRLQAQDLGKVGAMQDLMRGVEKLLPRAKEVINRLVTVKPEVPGIESLLKRANLFLEDADWDNAKEYYNRVLDIDPENPAAYLGLAYTSSHYKSIEDVITAGNVEFFGCSLCDKVNRFGDERIRIFLLESQNKTLHVKQELSEKEKLRKEQAIEEERKRIIKQQQEEKLQKEKEKERKLKLLCDLRKKYKEASNCMLSTKSNDDIAVKADGTVFYSGAFNFSRAPNFFGMIGVTSGDDYVAGIRQDGSVNIHGTMETFDYDLPSFSNIISISADTYHIVGLKEDGTVVAAWVASDGGDPVDSGECVVENWTDIVAISAGEACTIGLKADGTVVATQYMGEPKYYTGQCDVENWSDIVAISAGTGFTIGLKADGTVVATQYTGNSKNYSGQCDVGSWTDIIAISAGSDHTVGLRSDGTVVATQYTGNCQEYTGRRNVETWTDIIAISAGLRTLGLRKDGTVISTDTGIYDWKLFDSIEGLQQEREAKFDKAYQKELLKIQQEKMEEDERKRQEKAYHDQRKLENKRMYSGLCPYCGGTFKGLFKKVCTQCGKPKDY